jgi:hypothetical protein
MKVFKFLLKLNILIKCRLIACYFYSLYLTSEFGRNPLIVVFLHTANILIEAIDDMYGLFVFKITYIAKTCYSFYKKIIKNMCSNCYNE